jgi:hypothetical protein
MVFYIRIGSLERDFGHAYSAQRINRHRNVWDAKLKAEKIGEWQACAVLYAKGEAEGHPLPRGTTGGTCRLFADSWLNKLNMWIREPFEI